MYTDNTDLSTVGLSLFLATPLLELHATHVHDSGGDLVYVVLLLLGETKDVHGLLYYKIHISMRWGIALILQNVCGLVGERNVVIGKCCKMNEEVTENSILIFNLQIR